MSNRGRRKSREDSLHHVTLPTDVHSRGTSQVAEDFQPAGGAHPMELLDQEPRKSNFSMIMKAAESENVPAEPQPPGRSPARSAIAVPVDLEAVVPLAVASPRARGQDLPPGRSREAEVRAEVGADPGRRRSCGREKEHQDCFERVYSKSGAEKNSLHHLTAPAMSANALGRSNDAEHFHPAGGAQPMPLQKEASQRKSRKRSRNGRRELTRRSRASPQGTRTDDPCREYRQRRRPCRNRCTSSWKRGPCRPRRYRRRRLR